MAEIDVATWVMILIIYSLVSMFLMPYMYAFQARMGISQLRKCEKELQKWAMESKQTALRTITKHGRTKRDVEKEFSSFLEFFAIGPVSEDPLGVLSRLEHVLDVRKHRFEDAVKRFAPNADPEAAATLEMVIEGAMASYTLYQLVRHFTILASKTKNIHLTTLLQMNLPFIREAAKGYLEATKAFAEWKPIGDGVGPLAAVLLTNGGEWKEPIKDTMFAEIQFEKRKVLVVKAKGPGGRVGKPGELIKWLIKRRKIARVIMIDAAGKLEGEKSGEVVEGVGAAIGGPPTEKYKIEKITTKLKIPVDAIAIKESFIEAIKPLHKNLAKGSETAAELVKKGILERTRPGDTVIVAGIGNTIGIGQRKEELPKEFPTPEKEREGIESNFLPLRRLF